MKLYICENVKNAKWRKDITNDKKVSLAFAKKCMRDFLGEKENAVEIEISKNEYGKPYVENLYKLRLKNKDEVEKIKIDIPLFFSLSHSEDMMICAVACFNIGADCQKKNIDDVETCIKIAKRFYTDEENAFLDDILLSEDYDEEDSDREYINHFFKIWAKKESYIKYTGKGLAEGLKTFSVANEKRQKNYFGEVYFKRIALSKLKKIKKAESNQFYIYLCYNKENKNILEIKYVY